MLPSPLRTKASPVQPICRSSSNPRCGPKPQYQLLSRCSKTVLPAAARAGDSSARESKKT